MGLNIFKKISEAKSLAKTYKVGLLQTQAYRVLKKHTTEVLEEYGISAVDWALLGVVYEQPDGLRFIELAELLSVDAPFVTTMTESLEKKGFLTITSHATDKRAKIVSLSAKGKGLIPKIEAVLRKKTKVLLGGISIKDMYTYLKVLKQITKNSIKKP